MFSNIIICNVLKNGEVIVQDQGGYIPNKEILARIKSKVDSLSKLTHEQIEFENWRLDKEYEEEHKRLNDEIKQRTLVEKKETVGSIYLAKDLFRGCYKIGFSTNLKARLDQLKTANAGIEYAKHYNGTMGDEKKLHSTFEGVRVSGEWFSLTELHLAEIDNYFSCKQH